jgi:PhnB protein
MPIRLNPYLNFRDNTREAMTFYQSVLGGELDISTFGDFHASEDSAEQDKVMHSHLVTADGFDLMAADTPNSMEFNGQTGVSVSLSGDDEEKLRGWFDGLSEGGTVVMPFEQAPWGATFGMVIDRFGASWLVNCGPEN